MSYEQIPVAPALMKALALAHRSSWLNPLATLKDVKAEDLSREVGRLEGIREVLDWIKREYDACQGSPQDVLRFFYCPDPGTDSATPASSGTSR